MPRGRDSFAISSRLRKAPGYGDGIRAGWSVYGHIAIFELRIVATQNMVSVAGGKIYSRSAELAVVI